MPIAKCRMKEEARLFIRHLAIGIRHSIQIVAAGRKPNSVSLRQAQGGDHFSGPSVARRLKQPTRGCAGLVRLVLGLNSPHIWSCCRWGLPCRSSHPERGALLPHHFTLTGISPGGFFLLHFPSDCSALTLSSTGPEKRRGAFSAVRTFLTRIAPGAIAALTTTSEL